MVQIIHRELSYAVVGAAMSVHTVLGANYLEAVYQKALAHELTLRGIAFVEQVRLQVMYKDVNVGDYIADFVVEGKIVLELKSAKLYHQAFGMQALNYLAATDLHLAIVLCFGDNKLLSKRIIR